MLFRSDERLAYVIAAYHDTGLCRDRATHHLVSGEILMADSTLRQWFSDTEILLMKEAVEDHRASTDHEPRSIYGKIVAEADRIIDPDITLRRTVSKERKAGRDNPASAFHGLAPLYFVHKLIQAVTLCDNIIYKNQDSNLWLHPTFPPIRGTES